MIWIDKGSIAIPILLSVCLLKEHLRPRLRLVAGLIVVGGVWLVWK